MKHAFFALALGLIIGGVSMAQTTQTTQTTDDELTPKAKLYGEGTPLPNPPRSPNVPASLLFLAPNNSRPSFQDQTPSSGGQESAANAVPHGWGLDVKAMMGFGGSAGTLSVVNVPASLRTVPSNNLGPLATGIPVTIPDSSFSVKSSSISAQIGFGPEYSFGRFTVRGGGLLSFLNLTSGPPVAGGGNVDEINQFGTSQRGTGTSLVYYSIFWPRTPSISPFGELEVRLSRFVSVLGGYNGRENSSVTLQNGYDQNDKLTSFSNQKLASSSVKGAPYGGFKVNIHGPALAIVVEAAPVNWTSFSTQFPVGINNPSSGVLVRLGIDVALTQKK